MTTPRGAVAAAGGTHAGLIRDQNEDRWLIDEARGLYCVVDGVGGHPGGERASAIALELLRTRLGRETGTPAERLREAITLANNAILDAARQTPSLAGMTCVLTAAVVTGRTVTVGHVGDTRLYKLRAGALRKLTHDHSPIGEREDAGELTEDEAMRHARRNEVYRDVGAQPHAPDDRDFVEIVEAPFEDDAALLLCSDGLTDQVSSVSVRRILEANAGRPGAAVDELIRAANAAGGKDNVTVVVVEAERFAATVKAPRAAGRAAAESARPGDAGMVGATRPARWSRPWVVLPLGILIGALGTVAAWYAWPAGLPSPGAIVTPAPVPGEQPRTWKVGLSPEADMASIADALAAARAGDTVSLAAGDYRESVQVTSAVTIEGPAGAVIRPPLGAPAGWTAVVVRDVQGVRIKGVTILGEGPALARGLVVERAGVELADVRIAGAGEMAVLLAEGARAILTTTTLTDNAGSAIVVRPGASLALRHSLVLRNGTTARPSRPAIELAEGAIATLAGNAIGDNGGPAVTGWPVEHLPALLRDNLVRPAPRIPARRAPAPAARPAQAPR